MGVDFGTNAAVCVGRVDNISFWACALQRIFSGLAISFGSQVSVVAALFTESNESMLMYWITV